MAELTENQKNKNIKIAVIISYTAFVFNIIATLYYQRYILAHLGDTQYGLNSFVSSITSWLTLMTFGLSSTYVRFATIEKKKDPQEGLNKINGFYFLLLLIASIASLFIGAIIIILFYTGNVGLSQYGTQEKTWINELLVISVLTTSFSFISSLFTLFEFFNSRLIWMRATDFVVRILTLGTGIVVVYFGGNIVVVSISAAVIQIIISIVHFVYCFVVLKMKISFKLKNDYGRYAKTVFPFSLFIFLNIIIDQINSSLGKLTLGFLDTAESVTILSLGMEFYTYSSTIFCVISSNYIPKINQLAIDRNYDEENKLFLKVSRTELVLMFFIVGGFASCGREFITAWIGSGKIQVFYIALVLLLVTSVPFSQNTSIEIQRAYNKHQFTTLVYLIMSVINICITVPAVYFLPEEYKVYGAVVGTAISIIICSWFILNVYYKKTLKLPIGEYFKSYILFFVVGAISAAIIIFLYQYLFDISSLNKWVAFIIEGFSYTFVYFLLLFFLFYRQIKAKITVFITNQRRKKISQ
jgi:O-antigen/teichoic acid export membrane protein